MKFKVLFVFLFLASFISAQDFLAEQKMNRIQKIYDNLEYNTTAFNDLKKTWIVTDPVYVREIYNKFVVKNGLKIRGKKPTMQELRLKSNDIYEGDVFIDVRKRYYDGEIELLRFFTESPNRESDTSDYFFDEVYDFVYIREILGVELYEDLKKQFYALNDITKTLYDFNYQYNFDIYLHLLEPEMMVWNLTTNARNKYLVSLFGKWGIDRAAMPGWYYPDYYSGVRLKYSEYIVNTVPKTTYLVELGFGIPAKQFSMGDANPLNARRLSHSGTNIYMHFIGSPLGMITPELKDVELDIEGSFALSEDTPDDVKNTDSLYFFSNRNYFTLTALYPALLDFGTAGKLKAGGGFGLYDIKRYLSVPGTPLLEAFPTNIPGNFRWMLGAEAHLEGDGAIISHKISTLFHYNFNDGNGFLGLKFFVMVTNSVGFDFKMFSPLQFSGSLPNYRNDSYFVFSPVIRINY
ncbi:MAG: hypothetical protein AMXMBFR48_09070 [Ignavibacteriales bacterium]